MSWVLFEERMADISPDNFQWAIKCTIQFMGCVCVSGGGGGEQKTMMSSFFLCNSESLASRNSNRGQDDTVL